MEEERAVAMARRLTRTATRAGIPDTDVALLGSGFADVMDRRSTMIDDPAHRDYLHPARTVLILLDDVASKSVAILLAAVEYDSWIPTLSGAAPAIAERSARAAALFEQFPAQGLDDAATLEALVVADSEARDAALAEQLDHVRHLHLGPARAWAAAHARVRSVYLPAASRAHPMLGRRFARWAEAFEWRFLRSPAARDS